MALIGKMKKYFRRREAELDFDKEIEDSNSQKLLPPMPSEAELEDALAKLAEENPKETTI